MRLEGELTLLRVHLRSTDKSGWSSAADVLVERAKSQGLSGATLLRGIYGLDIRGDLLEIGGWSIVEHVPVILEIVDNPDRIGEFLSTIRDVVSEGIVTLERGHVLAYRHSRVPFDRAAMSTELPRPIVPLSTLPSMDYPEMKNSCKGQLLRVFIGESDVWEGLPLYKAIVTKAKELGLAGATVLRGSMGFGANSRVHTNKLLELSTDLPIVIEIVDLEAKLQPLLPFLDKAVNEGLITIEDVQVLFYRASGAEAAGQGG